MITAGFVLLTAYAVWQGTEQRLGTTDELRTLAGVVAALAITAGTAYLLG